MNPHRKPAALALLTGILTAAAPARAQPRPALINHRVAGNVVADHITKESLDLGSQTRHYYLLVPDSVGSDPAPLLIVLHGSGRDGRSLVEPWQELAAREHLIVAGPDATDRNGWQVPQDGPAFLYLLVEAVANGREARDLLVAHDFPATLTEIVGHDHNYYKRADEINRQAWAFLRDVSLDEEPQYQLYNYARR